MMTMNKLLSKIQNKTRVGPNNPLKIQTKPLSFTLYITNSTGQLEVFETIRNNHTVFTYYYHYNC